MKKSFTYRATTSDGHIVDGFMEGPEEFFVASKLQELGLIPIRISVNDVAQEATRGLTLGFSLKKVGRGELLAFTKEMSSLLRAGVPLDRGLRILIENISSEKVFSKVLGEVLRDVVGGSSLADAVGAHPKVFSRLYVNMVRSGESSGTLETTLERLAEFLERSHEIRGQVTSALVYPAFLTFVSGVSIIILLLFVIPKFASTFSDIGVSLPMSTEFLLALSHVVVQYWWLIVFLILMMVFSCRYYINTPSGKFAWDNLKLRLPVIGGLVQRIEVARFARTLGTILNGGVPILESLGIVREVAINSVIVETIGGLQVKVKRGESIGGSLKGNPFIPSLAVEMISVGEETGRLPEILIEIADTFDKQVSEYVKRLLSLLEPSLILFMGLIVGGIVVSMLLAIFSINEIPF